MLRFLSVLIGLYFLFPTIGFTKPDYNKLGFYRVAAISPPLELGNPEENLKIHLKEIKAALAKKASVILFPELSLTGYTIEDLFHSEDLLARSRDAVAQLAQKTRGTKSVILVGAPYRTFDGRLYNVAFVLANGKVVGAIPKTHLPNYAEFYDRRWFNSGENVNLDIQDAKLGNFKLSTNQLFKIQDMIFAVEVCEDAWAAISPGSRHALKGANVIFNLSASNELVGKSDYRRSLILNTSARLNTAYVYASSGPMESTKDLVFGGHIIVGENGSLLAEGERFKFEGERVFADLDIQKLLHERMKNMTYGSQVESTPYSLIDLTSDANVELRKLNREFSQTPFVPSNPAELEARSLEIVTSQAVGLARRLKSTGSKAMVIGVSGGLDSTLALLVSLEAAKILGWSPQQIVGVTMPGFGTTSGTKNSALELMTALGVTQREIPIGPAVEQHFRDIGHDPSLLNDVYENSQARERTKILFDIANQVKGIVVGTGDLSEACLGWCTYNGDHMSSYNVNTSIPKTLIKFLVEWYANFKSDKVLQKTLKNVLNTEISPELLPPDAQGRIQQKTEGVVGPYVLVDFFIYHFLRNGSSLERIFELARIAFKGRYSDREIAKWELAFFRRYVAAQFKRTTSPAGPKVGSISVSPRGDLRFPDEIRAAAIINKFEAQVERRLVAACTRYFK